MTLLERIKIANRITVSVYDEEFGELIEEAKADLKLRGITQAEAESDPNIRKAIVLYCSIHHGQREDRDMLQRSYDDLKARLGMSTGYTEWAERDQEPEPEPGETDQTGENTAETGEETGGGGA